MGGRLHVLLFTFAVCSFAYTAGFAVKREGTEVPEEMALVQAEAGASQDAFSDWRHQKVPRSILKGQIALPEMPSWVSGIGSKLEMIAEQTLNNKLEAIGENMKANAQKKLEALENKAQMKSATWIEKLDHKLDSILTPMAVQQVDGDGHVIVPDQIPTLTSAQPQQVLSAAAPMAALEERKEQQLVAPISKGPRILPSLLPPMKTNPNIQASVNNAPVYTPHGSSMKEVRRPQTSEEHSSPSILVSSETSQTKSPKASSSEPVRQGLADGIATKVLEDATPVFDLVSARSKLDEAMKLKFENTVSAAAEFAGLSVARLTGVDPKMLIQKSGDQKLTIEDAGVTLDKALKLGAHGLQTASVNLANSLVNKLSTKIISLPTEKIEKAAIAKATNLVNKLQKVSSFLTKEEPKAVLQQPLVVPQPTAEEFPIHVDRSLAAYASPTEGQQFQETSQPQLERVPPPQPELQALPEAMQSFSQQQATTPQTPQPYLFEPQPVQLMPQVLVQPTLPAVPVASMKSLFTSPFRSVGTLFNKVMTNAADELKKAVNEPTA